MARLSDVVIVGASLAGLRAAEALRARGYDGRLTLVGAEKHLPYDRPPLSKEILRGEWEPDRIGLRRQDYESLGAELLLGRRATSLDLAKRTVTLDGTDAVEFGGLVIATGATPRRLGPVHDELAGVHVLRTLDDALAIRAAFQAHPRVVVVGAGFIGLEVAAAARSFGLEVVVVEPQPAPLASVLGAEMGAACARLHRDHGVDLRCGVAVDALEGHGRVERVRLGDGTALSADLVVVGIGVVPVTGWLGGSGLRIENGVVCDSTLSAGPQQVVAAGDVARWHNRLFDEVMRVEHWTNAVEQGVAAAGRLLAADAEAVDYAPVPLFWSDQYEVKVQFAGRVKPDDEVRIVEGRSEEFRFVALYGRKGRLTGALAFRRPRQLLRYVDLIGARASWDDAIAAAPPRV
jgi:NADPH-dependent 2,4-dienoyl-CoA reductase/sulfur reductase-like enzyme